MSSLRSDSRDKRVDSADEMEEDASEDEVESPGQDRSQSGNHQRDRRRNGCSRTLKGLSGLPNLGNTCYLNAPVQVLVHTPSFAGFFVDCADFIPPRLEVGNSRAITQRRMVHSLADIVYQVWDEGLKVASPHNFVRDVLDLNPDYRGLGQQDAQEFLRRTLDVLHEELQESTPFLHQRPLDASSEAQKSSSVQKKDDIYVKGELGHPHNGSLSPSQRSPENGNAESKSKETHRHEKRLHNSIVLDIFAGVLISEVKCNHCGKVSVTEEPVLDQSISIPSKKARQRLLSAHKNYRASVESEEASESQEPENQNVTCAQNSWLSFLIGMFSSVSNVNISLQDCLLQYYEPEHLTGNDKYKCEHCDQFRDCTKKLSLLKPPEVLTLHLKRFRYESLFGNNMGTKISEHIQFPIKGLDMRPFIKTSEEFKEEQENAIYDLLAVIEHRGALHGGHYIAYIRNNSDGKWFEFNDSQVNTISGADVHKLEGYMLFYKLRVPKEKEQEREDVKKLIEDEESQEERVYISRLWLLRFLHMLHPGPIDHHPFMCSHERIHIKQEDEKKLRPIPLSAWEKLLEKYKGGPILNRIEKCSQCMKDEYELMQRRDYEQRLVHEHDKTYIEPGQSWYIIDKKWLQSWLSFVHQDQLGAVPGPISNGDLLEKDGVTPKTGLDKGTHYRGVNKQVWDIFFSIYGGGPPIVRSRLDIYAPVVNPPADDGSRRSNKSARAPVRSIRSTSRSVL
mmetsp:Transcript_32576/g.103174  ORF Transcript_32576/g.103174 Transcript_32576/m.103174 type:complete len:735 (-) Transcript_32576:61-2265(-)